MIRLNRWTTPIPGGFYHSEWRRIDRIHPRYWDNLVHLRDIDYIPGISDDVLNSIAEQMAREVDKEVIDYIQNKIAEQMGIPKDLLI